MRLAGTGACLALELQPVEIQPLDGSRHRPAHGKSGRGKQQQPRHQAHERFLRRVQEHHRSGRAAHQSCKTHQQGRAQVFPHILAVGGNRRQLAGPDGHRICGVGLHRQHIHAQQRRKRQKRTATGHGVQHAGQKCGHHQPHPVPVDGCQYAMKIGHEIFIVECPGRCPVIPVTPRNRSPESTANFAFLNHIGKVFSCHASPGASPIPQ